MLVFGIWMLLPVALLVQSHRRGRPLGWMLAGYAAIWLAAGVVFGLYGLWARQPMAGLAMLIWPFVVAEYAAIAGTSIWLVEFVAPSTWPSPKQAGAIGMKAAAVGFALICLSQLLQKAWNGPTAPYWFALLWYPTYRLFRTWRGRPSAKTEPVIDP